MRKYIILLWMLIVPCTIFGAEHQMIKIGLESVYKNAQTIRLSSDKPIEVGYLDEKGFEKLETLSGTNITVTKNGDGTYCVRNGAGRKLLTYDDDELVFRGYDNQSGLNLITVGDKNKKYRGAIGMGGTTGITPYNLVGMEEYLYGVIPCEMVPSWHAEALKAQAVAARSMAIYQYNRFIKSGYNLVDTTSSQVYGGYNKEDPRTTAAVKATKGQYAYYNGKVAETVYFSTSGGYTESSKNVWGNDVPYLVSQSDSYEKEPEQAPWTRQITLEEIDRCLSSAGANIGKAVGVQVASRTSSGRVEVLNILGTQGVYPLTLERIRTFFSSSNNGSLKSRMFTLQGNTNPTNILKTTANNTKLYSQAKETIYDNVTINGKGYGHGVGMSQSGANGMAKADYDYKSILKHYYKGVTIK